MKDETVQNTNSYGQILKSTSLIGGASLINMAIGMVKTKFVAVLLGPSGLGLMGVYTAISSMVSAVSSMGLSSSGVRQIAEAYGTGDEDRIAKTVKTLRRTVWITGFVGLLIMVLGCSFLSRTSFGSTEHSIAIALLGITILLGNIAIGQSCILQGTRRISALAKVSVIGALNGTAISIPCFYFWGKSGIVPSLLLTAVAALVTSWWYARQVHIKPLRFTWNESRDEAAALLRLGIPLMLAGLMTVLAGYLMRILLIRLVGLDGVGIWLSAFTLSGVIVNFVLSAMGTDYYPRLTAVANDNLLLGKTVNTQTEIALLLAVPGLAATIIFAPLVIKIFYSGKFDAAVDILRWSVFGIFGRVISWPLAYIMLAKGMGKTFFVSEAFGNTLHVALIWFCTKWLGLPGTGVAFLILYFVYTIEVYVIGFVVARTTWSRTNMIHISAFAALLILNGCISIQVKNIWYQYAANIVLLAIVSWYCLNRLMYKSGIGFRDIIAKVRMNERF
ncbi:MAG: O-antigen translocase [Smithella sp.]|nr:O-antigen translocase [Smithella sp.]